MRNLARVTREISDLCLRRVHLIRDVYPIPPVSDGGFVLTVLFRLPEELQLDALGVAWVAYCEGATTGREISRAITTFARREQRHAARMRPLTDERHGWPRRR